jgi:lipopolysaccharide transport system ATP-binding protein
MSCDASMGAPIIEARGVSKHFALFGKPSHRLWHLLWPRSRRFHTERRVLEDITFDVHRGETLGVVGRNGAGKSTLLGLVCGTLVPSAGGIVVRGKVSALLELGAGFNPELTGRENIDLCARLHGLSSRDIDARRDSIIAFADIGDYIDQPVKFYSSGMFTRLGFAVAAHVDADLLVVDEALAVGDAFFVQKCMRHLEGFRAQGGTLVFVSHDMGAVTALCDRVLWITDGKLAMDGPPKDVAAAYLAQLYGAPGAAARAAPATARAPADVPAARGDARPRDVRNEIAVSAFHTAHDFGDASATLESADFSLAPDGNPLDWMVGGEHVALTVRLRAHRAIDSLIVGFVVKDRHGQPLFGDNTCLTHLDEPLAVPAGACATAAFEFRMPILPMGDYAVSLAVSDGTQRDHVMHQWIHDAIVLSSRASGVATGLVGIPMHRIACTVDAPSETVTA